MAHFYDIKEWKDLYRNPDNHSENLKIFAWANANSIERYHVTVKNEGFDYQDLEPHLVIFPYWNKEEELLLKGLEVSYESEPHEYLWHYFKAANTHLFWTRHPIDLSFKQIH